MLNLLTDSQQITTLCVIVSELLRPEVTAVDVLLQLHGLAVVFDERPKPHPVGAPESGARAATVSCAFPWDALGLHFLHVQFQFR